MIFDITCWITRIIPPIIVVIFLGHITNILHYQIRSILHSPQFLQCELLLFCIRSKYSLAYPPPTAPAASNFGP
jgi:hypothetical protein